MELEVEHLPRIAVVRVAEELVGEESEELVETVRRILEDGTYHFIVDMSESAKLDSSGIGVLVQALNEVSSRDGKLVLVMPRRFFDDPLHQGHGGPQVFEMYRSRGEAIDALLDLSIVQDWIEPEVRRKIARVNDATESQRRRASLCLKFAYAVFLISALLLLVVWLK